MRLNTDWFTGIAIALIATSAVVVDTGAVSAQAEPTQAEPTGQVVADKQPTPADDLKQLAETSKRVKEFRPEADWRMPDGRFGDMVEFVSAALNSYQQAVQLKNEVKPLITAVEERAGKNTAEWYEYFGFAPSSEAERDYRTIKNFVMGVEESGPKNAHLVIKLIKGNLDGDMMKQISETARQQRVRETRELLVSAPLFAPDDKEVADEIEKLKPVADQKLAEFAAAARKAIEGQTWKPTRNGTENLAGQVKQFVTAHEVWGGNKAQQTQVMAVSVQGDWFVAKRNILGQPAQWGLPVHVAIHTKSSAPDLARVYSLSIITTTDKQAPPFAEIWVGGSWDILRAKVK